MKFLLCPEGNHHFSALLLFILTVLYTSPTGAAELLPFPSQNRAPQYQQAAPRYQEPQPNPEIEQFRSDIAGFPCPELDSLYKRIGDQYNTARTATDREYFNLFLSELYREKSSRCNH